MLRDYLPMLKVDEVQIDFVHKQNDEYCDGGVVKVIDNDGAITYVCTGCGKEWDTGEKATPKN